MFDFENNQHVPSLDGVPENLRPLYEPNEGEEGGFNIRNDAVTQAAVPALAGTFKALSVARAEANGLKGKSVDLAKLSAYGTTVEEIVAGVSKKITELEEAAAKGDPDAKLNLEKLKADMTAAHATDRESDLKKITSLTGQLHKRLVSSQFAKASAKGDDPDLIEKVLGDQVRVIEENDESRAVIVDAAGDIRHNGVGAEMSIGELMQEARKSTAFGRIFSSEAPDGGGTPPGRQVVKPANRGGNDGKDKSAVNKIQDGLKNLTAGRST